MMWEWSKYTYDIDIIKEILKIKAILKRKKRISVYIIYKL